MDDIDELYNEFINFSNSKQDPGDSDEESADETLLFNSSYFIDQQLAYQENRNNQNNCNNNNDEDAEDEEARSEEETELDRLKYDYERYQLHLALKQLSKPPLLLKPIWLICGLIHKFLGLYRVRMGSKRKKTKEKPDSPIYNALAGLLVGIVIGYSTFFLFVFTFAKSPHISTFVSCYLMLITTFGFSLSNEFRCLILLVLPYLSANRIRWLFLLFAFSLSVSGPAMNFLHNSGNFRNSIACILAQVSTNMNLVKLLLLAPLKVVLGKLQHLVDAINRVLSKMRFSLFNINLNMLQFLNIFKNQQKWIKNIIASCGDEVALKNQCLALFNNIYFNCKDYLNAFSFLCNAVRLFGKSACKSVSELQAICDQQSELLKYSEVSLNSEEMLNEQTDELLELIGRNNITFQSTLSTNNTAMKINSNNEFTEVLQNKMDSFVGMLNMIKNIFNWLMLVWTLLTMIQLVLQASLFKKLWLASDAFANDYITEQFIEQETRAIIEGLVPTVPLIGKERRMYRKLTSLKWTISERRKAFQSFIFLLLTMFSIIMIMCMDYAMYEAVLMITPLYQINFTDSSSADADSITGNSAFSDIVRSMNTMINPIKEVNLDINAAACRPNGSPPDSSNNLIIITLLSLTLISVVIEVYVLRIRHQIMIWYYPARASQRAAWLRTHIRNSRGMFLKMIHKIKTADIKSTRKVGKVTLLGKYLNRYPKLTKVGELMGIKRVNCAYCGAEGNPKKKAEFLQKFIQCTECAAYYCHPCQVESESMCTLCNTPLFKIGIEVDFETFSTDEEIEELETKYFRRLDFTTEITRSDHANINQTDPIENTDENG